MAGGVTDAWGGRGGAVPFGCSQSSTLVTVEQPLNKAAKSMLTIAAMLRVELMHPAIRFAA